MKDTDAPPVVAAVADMLFAARIRAAAGNAGRPVLFPRSVEELMNAAAHASLLLVDLDARWLDAAEVIGRLKNDTLTAAVPIIAFVSHVRADAIEAARTAGADRVLARSAFVRDLPELLR
jgi:CheY-like chemotaxis protein